MLHDARTTRCQLLAKAAVPFPHCSVLMGANIAADIARGELSEATIAYSVLANGQLLQVG